MSFDVADCRKHCPYLQNTGTGRWLSLALEEIERLQKMVASKRPRLESKPAGMAFDLDDVGASTDHDVKEALALAEEIESLAGNLPGEGEDFGLSVSEKAADIAANIEAHNRVTDAQFNALENMLNGLNRWFHD